MGRSKGNKRGFIGPKLNRYCKTNRTAGDPKQEGCGQTGGAVTGVGVTKYMGI